MDACSSATYYGKPLSKEEIVELRGDAEEAQYKLYTKMLDYIYSLESRMRTLERQNRELRGQLGRLG